MRLTAGQLRQIIKEELSRVLGEADDTGTPTFSDISRGHIQGASNHPEDTMPPDGDILAAAKLIDARLAAGERLESGVTPGNGLDQYISEFGGWSEDMNVEEFVAALFGEEPSGERDPGPPALDPNKPPLFSSEDIEYIRQRSR